MHIITLLETDQRTHFHAFLRRVAGLDLFKFCLQCLSHILQLRLWNDNPADSGTLLSSFGRHFANDFTNEQRKFRLFWRDIFPQHAAIQGIGFHGEGD
ncbi:hypothetical protein D3C75_665050 [compost metagenome]